MGKKKMPLYGNNYSRGTPPKKREKKKPPTGPSLEKIVRIMIEEGSLVPESHPRVKLPKLLKRISHVKFHKKGVSVTYKEAVEVTQSYKIPKKTKSYSSIPEGWLPLNIDTTERLSEELGADWDQGGYLRGTIYGKKVLPTIINLERKVVRGQCALSNQICEAQIPIVCCNCQTYLERYPSRKPLSNE